MQKYYILDLFISFLSLWQKYDKVIASIPISFHLMQTLIVHNKCFNQHFSNFCAYFGLRNWLSKDVSEIY